MLSNRKKKRSPGFYIAWGGFNAGSLLGLLDALLILAFGLGMYDRFGSIFGLIAVDALGLGLAGIVFTLFGFKILPRIHPMLTRYRMVFTGILLMGFGIGLTSWNLGWVFKSVGAGAPSGNRMNVLLVSIDTLRADAVGAGGNPWVRTPVLDRLTQTGTQFSNAVCTVPMTTPSHASMMTSTIPAVHGARENRYRLGAENVTLAEILSEHEYRTAAFVSCFPLDRRFGLDQGFLLYEDCFAVPGDLRQASWLKLILAMKTRGLMERSAVRTNSVVLPWIRKYASHGPFMLWVHYFDPHAPYVPSRREIDYFSDTPVHVHPFQDPDDRQKASAALPANDHIQEGDPEKAYFGEVSSTDRQVFKLLQALEERGVFDKTILCMLADHGESFGEHGRFYTHGEDIYEPALAIPLILSGGGVPCRKLTERLCSTTDLAPTILHLLDLKPHPRMQGFNMLGSAHRSAELIENYGIIMTPGTIKQRGLRTAEMKYISFESGNSRELYDLASDPGERNNLKSIRAELTEVFQKLVADGFEDAARTGVVSDVDVSTSTREKMQALGYFLDESGGDP